VILQTSLSDQVETVVALSQATTGSQRSAPNSIAHLRNHYRHFLSHLGQREIGAETDEIRWITDAGKLQDLANLFSNDSLLDDRGQAAVISRNQDEECLEKKDRLNIALEEIGFFSAEYAALFQTIITDIFILPSRVAKGGSTSQAVGVIWANPRISYTIFDLMEILVHEFTHHAMFLDELRYGHYAYVEILKRSTWARSAILNVDRPLDKVLHSTVVAVEVLLWRSSYLGHPVQPRVHPPTDVLVEQVSSSIASMEASVKQNRAIFQPRALALLANAKRVMADVFGCSSAQTVHRHQGAMPPIASIS
jgi:hypothetical protein